MQPNRKIGEKQDKMGRPLGMNGCKQTSKESRGGKTSRMQEKGKATAEMGGLHEEGHIEDRGKMKDVEMGRPIENYGKKEQKEWLDRQYLTLLSPLYSREQRGRAHKKYNFNSFLDRKILHESAGAPICPAIVE